MKKHYRLEAELEKDCTQAAIDLGAEHRKLDTGMNSKGQLDHAYWLPNGKHFIVEFKLPGKKPSPLQQRRIDRLRRFGHTVHIIDNYADFLHILGDKSWPKKHKDDADAAPLPPKHKVKPRQKPLQKHPQKRQPVPRQKRQLKPRRNAEREA